MNPWYAGPARLPSSTPPRPARVSSSTPPTESNAIRNYGDDGSLSTTSPLESNAIRNYGDDGSPSTIPPPDPPSTPNPYTLSFWKKN